MKFLIIIAILATIANAMFVINVNDATQGSVECLLCNYVVDKVEHFIANNKTVTEMETILDKDCELFGKYSGVCQQYVNEYLPEIITMFEDKYSPEEICEEIHLCINVDNMMLNLEVEQVDYCELCHVAVDAIEIGLTNNGTVERLETMLDYICNLDKQYGQECAALVNDYFPLMVEKLENYLSTTDVCEELKLCN